MLQHKNENPFANILFNILIPVVILNKGHKWGLEPKIAVIIALSFPLFFTVKSLIQTRKVGFVPVLGLLNVLVSGTLTLLALGGIWFAIKEAAFPLLIGIFVFASAFTNSPFFESLFMNPATFDVDKLDSRLETQEKENKFHQLMKKATIYLSFSFLMSAILNFLLSLVIFKPLNPTLSDLEKQQILNEQLSQMTLYSLGVILVPSMIFLGGILYFTFKKVNHLTGLTMEDLLKTKN